MHVRVFVRVDELKVGDKLLSTSPLFDMMRLSTVDVPYVVETAPTPADAAKWPGGYCEFMLSGGGYARAIPYRIRGEHEFVLVERDGIKFSYDDDVFQ